MGTQWISTNAVKIAVSILPIYPAGAVEEFADGSDVWTGPATESADVVVTPDGFPYAYTKNTPVERTLTVAPNSPIAAILDMVISGQQSRFGSTPEPFTVTVVVTHLHNGQIDTYSGGIIADGEQGMKVTQDRLGNKQYTFKFALPMVTTGVTKR